MELSNEAEELALALDHKLIDVAEAIRWADARLLARDDAPECLIDVSLAGSLYPDEVARLLRRIPGERDLPGAARRFPARMAIALDAGRITPAQAARSLYKMYGDRHVPDNAAAVAILSIDDSFDLARAGTWGTLADAEQELRTFLARYR